MNNVLSEAAMTTEDFGTHSARKGTATYVSSCSTSGPSAASICLRAGWTLPGVQDKYVRFEAAGDMIVGRYVAGLLFDSPKFAILSPFFDTQSGDDNDSLELRRRIEVALDSIFPGAPPNLRMVCQFGLASLLYHRSFLQETLPPNHLLFDTPIFSARAEADLDWLRQRAICLNFQDDDYIVPSGIPPHVGLMVELSQCKAEMAKMREDLTQSFENLLKRHINGSVMTMEALETAFASVLARSSLVQRIQQIPASPEARPVARSHTLPTQPVVWDGAFRSVPKKFVLPSGTIRVVWQQWCVGDPALRLLSKHDMSSRAKKIRLAELRRVMLLIENLLTENELKRVRSSADAAGILFEHIKTVYRSRQHLGKEGVAD